ncbi:hypothetical protein PAAG_05176 [Paracoccidioides lutzii Pb01]|uniref:Uncharacterized protein n=1 Tax=Paracoccidioides lutzii (strain ATCC MYA-826 / Pb01) TaxID=502779 RepID=C1H333_PARBA|nr:hypothetical protein PAAG_05176 [Paracoccidioides lutzii Pb01]EEH34127.2 hypothetical protein PAAG_05176 [Paracoccidioides lutzii Pb01]
MERFRQVDPQKRLANVFEVADGFVAFKAECFPTKRQDHLVRLPDMSHQPSPILLQKMDKHQTDHPFSDPSMVLDTKHPFDHLRPVKESNGLIRYLVTVNREAKVLKEGQPTR